MFKKLRTVVYRVSNIEEAKKWYTKALGLNPYFDEPFYVGFDINGSELGLDADIPGPTTGNHTISYWSVDDVGKAAKKLIGLGAKQIQPKTNVGGEIFIAVVEDPYGNHVGLIQGA